MEREGRKCQGTTKHPQQAEKRARWHHRKSYWPRGYAWPPQGKIKSHRPPHRGSQRSPWDSRVTCIGRNRIQRGPGYKLRTPVPGRRSSSNPGPGGPGSTPPLQKWAPPPKRHVSRKAKLFGERARGIPELKHLIESEPCSASLPPASPASCARERSNSRVQIERKRPGRKPTRLGRN